jgi:hypothetical protein
MSTLHSIKALLYDNQLTEDPNDFIARVNSEKSLSIDDICESAVSRGGADISAPAMEHAVNLFLKEMGYRLCDGFSINTGWFTASVHIRGTFESPTERFNPEKHHILFEFHQGTQLRRELELVSVEILGVADVGAVIAEVVDVKSGSVNDVITPGRNLKISGHKIKVVGDKPDIGVYFVSANSGTRIKVDSTDIAVNNPSEVMIITPALGADRYYLEITTQYVRGKTLLNLPRTARFDKILEVK